MNKTFFEYLNLFRIRRMAWFLFVIFGILTLAGCGQNKRQDEPKGEHSDNPKPSLASAFPLLDLLPADADFVLVGNDLAGIFSQLLGSRFLRDLLALPPINKKAEASGYAGDPANWLTQLLDRHPQSRRNYELSRDFLGSEVFLLFPKGASQQLSNLRKLYNLAQIVQGFARKHNSERPVPTQDGQPTEEEIGQAIPESASSKNQDPNIAFQKLLNQKLKPLVDQIDIPALIIGCKTGEQGRAYLEQRTTSLLKFLPDNVVRDEVISNNVNLKTLEVCLADLFTASNVAINHSIIKNYLGHSPESEETIRLLDKLLSKRVKLAFGFIGDRFVLAVASPAELTSLPLLKQERLEPDRRLAGRPEFEFASAYLDKKPFFLSYQSFDLLEKARTETSLAEFVEFSQFLLPPKLLKEHTIFENFQTDAKRIGGEFEKLLAAASFPQTMIIFVDSGLKIESRGGYSSPLYAKAAQLRSRALLDVGIAAYLGSIADKQGQARTYTLVEDFCTFGLKAFKAFVAPEMSEMDSKNFSLAESLILPRLQTIWEIIKDLELKALGSEHGIYLDMQETIPDGTLVPEVLRGEAFFPHFGYFSSVNDEKLLGEIWPRLLAWANDLTLLLPPLPGIQRPLPQPESRAVEGMNSWFYRIPEFLGQDALGVTIHNGFLFLGTSLAVQERLAKAIPKTAIGDTSSLHFEIRSAPILNALNKLVQSAIKPSDQTVGTGQSRLDPPSPEELEVVNSLAQLIGRFDFVQYNRLETTQGPSETLWIKLTP